MNRYISVGHESVRLGISTTVFSPTLPQPVDTCTWWNWPTFHKADPRDFKANQAATERGHRLRALGSSPPEKSLPIVEILIPV